MRDQFDDMVMGPTVADLIADGFLSRYRAFAPSTPNLKKVRVRGGDFCADELEDEMMKPTLVGDVVEHYRKLATGKRAILFATSIKHSKALVEAFEASGVAAAHLDGETPKGQREATVADFTAGRIAVLSNVGLFGEGFDVPAVEAAILARPTKSLSLHLQMIGRALRTAPGKDHAIILDHAGNLERLGFPDDGFEWSMDGVEKKKRKAGDEDPIKQCPTCFCVHRPAPICPACGHAYEAKPREIEQVAGELTEVVARGETTTKARQWQLKTLEDLIAHGRAKGYKPGWAYRVWSSRQSRGVA